MPFFYLSESDSLWIHSMYINSSLKERSRHVSHGVPEESYAPTHVCHTVHPDTETAGQSRPCVLEPDAFVNA